MREDGCQCASVEMAELMEGEKMGKNTFLCVGSAISAPGITLCYIPFI